MTETVGGRVDVTINGVVYSTVGEIEIDEANIEPDAVNNQDNSLDRIVKPGNYGAKVKLRHRKGLDIQTLLNSFFDLSMHEKDLNQAIMFTNAFVKGKASRNTGNGEYAEFEIVSAYYQRIDLGT